MKEINELLLMKTMTRLNISINKIQQNKIKKTQI